MRALPSLLFLSLATSPIALAQSTLLENVKNNPEEARSMCRQFKALNSQGISANSPQAINKVAKQLNLTIPDAEIVSTYVIGLNCPDVR